MSFDRDKGRKVIILTARPDAVVEILSADTPGAGPLFPMALMRERDLLPDDAPYYPEWGTDLSDFEDVP